MKAKHAAARIKKSDVWYKVFCALIAATLLFLMVPNGLRAHAENATDTENAAIEETQSEDNAEEVTQEPNSDEEISVPVLETSNDATTGVTLNFSVGASDGSQTTGTLAYQWYSWDGDVKQEPIFGTASYITDPHALNMTYDSTAFTLARDGSLNYWFPEVDPQTGEEVAYWDKYVTPKAGEANSTWEFDHWELNGQRLVYEGYDWYFQPGGVYNFKAVYSLGESTSHLVEMHLNGGQLDDPSEIPEYWTQISDDTFFTTVGENYAYADLYEEWEGYDFYKLGNSFVKYQPDVPGEVVTQKTIINVIWEEMDDVTITVDKGNNDAWWPENLKPAVEKGWELNDKDQYVKQFPYGTLASEVRADWQYNYPSCEGKSFDVWQWQYKIPPRLDEDNKLYAVWTTANTVKIKINYSDDEGGTMGSVGGPTEFDFDAGNNEWDGGLFEITKSSKYLSFYDYLDDYDPIFRSFHILANEDYYVLEVSVNGVEQTSDYAVYGPYPEAQEVVIDVHLRYPNASFAIGKGTIDNVPQGFVYDEESETYVKPIDTKMTCGDVVALWDGYTPQGIAGKKFLTWNSDCATFDSADFTKDTTWLAIYDDAHLTKMTFTAPDGSEFAYALTDLYQYNNDGTIMYSGQTDNWTDNFTLTKPGPYECYDFQVQIINNETLRYSYNLDDYETYTYWYQMVGVINPVFESDYQRDHSIVKWYCNGEPITDLITQLMFYQSYNFTYELVECNNVSGTIQDVQSGAKCSEASVVFTPQGEQAPTVVTQADQYGNYSIKLPKGLPGTLAFSWDGMTMTHTYTGEADEVYNVYYNLPPSVSINGTVLDYVGQPFNGNVWVRLFDNQGTQVSETRCMPNGSFIFHEVDIPSPDTLFEGYYVTAIDATTGEVIARSNNIHIDVLGGFTTGNLLYERSVNVDFGSLDPTAHNGFIVNGDFNDTHYDNQYFAPDSTVLENVYLGTKASLQTYPNNELRLLYNPESGQNHIDLTIQAVPDNYFLPDVWLLQGNQILPDAELTIGVDVTAEDTYKFEVSYTDAGNVIFNGSQAVGHGYFHVCHYDNDELIDEFDVVDFSDALLVGTEIYVDADGIIQFVYLPDSFAANKNDINLNRGTLEAVPADGYEFKGWIVNGETFEIGDLVNVEFQSDTIIEPLYANAGGGGGGGESEDVNAQTGDNAAIPFVMIALIAIAGASAVFANRKYFNKK